MFRSSRRFVRAGEVLSAAQKVKIAIAPATGNGNAVAAAAARADRFEEAGADSAAGIGHFQAEAIGRAH